ncbi:hypothetical protein JKF63_00234 [Porcisia hertigi]|uniref:Uncharacterized protein n=1 Tax=Porcisia hertigi TaxID=2761500 RepID=A0A836L0W4_9TRYP|nr:hypothetical protein JKF63_00234 [Porcisia hertigi]
MHSTPVAQHGDGSTAHYSHAAASREYSEQCWHTKKDVLSLRIHPVSAHAMFRVPRVLSPDDLSLLPLRELELSADGELCSVTHNPRTDARAGSNDATRELKRIHEVVYSKRDTCRLKIQPARNLTIRRVLEEEEHCHDELLPPLTDVPSSTKISQPSGAMLVKGDKARRKKRCRTHEYVKADIMSLRLSPLKNYAVCRIS